VAVRLQQSKTVVKEAGGGERFAFWYLIRHRDFHQPFLSNVQAVKLGWKGEARVGEGKDVNQI
jgi:hypothetical protein